MNILKEHFFLIFIACRHVIFLKVGTHVWGFRCLNPGYDNIKQTRWLEKIYSLAQFSYYIFESKIEMDFSYLASFLVHYIIVTYEEHIFHKFLVDYTSNLRRYSFHTCYHFSEISILFCDFLNILTDIYIILADDLFLFGFYGLNTVIFSN